MGFDYKYSLDIVSALIMIFLFIILKGKQKVNILMYRIYYWLVLTNFFAAIAEILMAVFANNIEIYGMSLVNIMGILLYICEVSLVVLFTIYVLCLAGIDIKADNAWKMAIFPFAALAIAMIVANPYSKLLFSIGKGAEIEKGSAFVTIVVYSVYCMFLWTFALIKYGNHMENARTNYLRIFIILHIVSVLLYYNMLFAGLFTFEKAIIAIIMIFAIQNPDDYFDKSNAMLYSSLIENVKLDFSRAKQFSGIYIRVHDADVLYDSFGTLNTNMLMRQAVEYMQNLHKSAMVYRCCKNAFFLKVQKMDSEKIESIKAEILERFSNTFRFGDLTTTFSIGLVSLETTDNISDIGSFEAALKNLEHAIIPIAGNLTYDMLQKNDTESDILEAVKKAVENDGFKVYYQPIYSTKHKKIVAAEALIRLFDDKLGFISPEVFIPLAEREGYILEIGKFVFTDVCRFYSENKLDQKGIEYIEVNLSTVQCMQYRLADEFVSIMHSYGLSSSQINFEITETSAMKSNAAVEMNINYFLDHGVDLSLDDYGTGYSNISYLYHLPFAFMKIDKSILWSSDKNDKANITLNNIFRMAKNLKMRIVVEGVETEEHIKKLLKLECDYFQGYYFSKPVAEMDFISYLENFSVPDVCLVQ